jgi:hypothetical protein
LEPVPISTPSGTLSVDRRLGRACHHLADHRRGGLDLVSGTSKTSSS